MIRSHTTRRFALSALCVLAFGAALAFPSALPGGGSAPDPDHLWAEDTVFAVRQVRPGVYFAVGRQGRLVGANSVFVVTDRDVILVDDHITPRAARALVAEIRSVTDKPLRYVVNTHFHYDHVSGNTIFGPEVEIVSHPATRQRLLGGGAQMVRDQLAAAERQVAALRARRDTTRGDSARAALDLALAEWTVYAEEYRTLRLVLPTLTADSGLVFHRGGGQELRVFWLGRGHTAGDVVVQMPREGLLLSGDLITNTQGPPFAADGYAGEWAATLRRLGALVGDSTETLPGHGEPFRGGARYRATADLFDDVWAQARAIAARALPPDSATRGFDMSRHLATFPALRNGLSRAAAVRAVDLAAGRAN